MLLCKGADDVIFARMESKYDLRVFDATRNHVNFYAERGTPIFLIASGSESDFP